MIPFRRELILHFLRGLCMGIVDVVPGVSGGTVALVFGIYGRLITAISQANREWIRLLWARRWRDSLKHVDASLLIPLAMGMASGIFVTALTVHRLLSWDATRPYTLAIFLGLIAGTVWLVMRQVRSFGGGWNPACIISTVMGISVGATIAFANMQQNGHGDIPLWYVFVGGMIGICAMILPGISGAMILIMLGLYGHVAGIPDALLDGDDIASNLAVLCIFAAGCLTGLMTFSRFLKWTLHHYGGPTMATLCGLMIGSLPNLWPYRIDRTPEIVDFEDKELARVWPTDFSIENLAIASAVLLAASGVLAADYVITRSRRRCDDAASDDAPRENSAREDAARVDSAREDRLSDDAAPSDM